MFNLCRTYSYQTVGYYVSLLAAARGHRPLPSVSTIQDMRTAPILRIVSDDLLEEIEKDLAAARRPTTSRSRSTSGATSPAATTALSQALFNHFPAPFLRAEFERADGEWRLESIRPVGSSEIPESHREFIQERAKRYFARPERPRKTDYRYDLAILVDPDGDRAAVGRGRAAPLQPRRREARHAPHAHHQGRLRPHCRVRRAVHPRDHRRQPPHLSLLAPRAGRGHGGDRRSRVDHPLHQQGLPGGAASRGTRSRTRGRWWSTARTSGASARSSASPACSRNPTARSRSASSKIVNERALAEPLEAVLRATRTSWWRRSSCPPTSTGASASSTARRSTPAATTWRRGHWQIVKHGNQGGAASGRVETLPVEDAPPKAVQLAERCAELIGDGLYGVDIKEVEATLPRHRGERQPEHRGRRRGSRPQATSSTTQVMGSIYRRLEHKAGASRRRDAAGRARAAAPLHLFEAFGVELEYMIVDARTLDVRPIADGCWPPPAAIDGSDVERGAVGLVERARAPRRRDQDQRPGARASAALAERIQSQVREINAAARAARRAADADARCTRGWTRTRELRLWPHENDVIYAGLRSHLRLPRPRLGEPAERAPQSAVRRRRRVRPTARRDPRACCRSCPRWPRARRSSDGRSPGSLDTRLDGVRAATPRACRRSPARSCPSRCSRGASTRTSCSAGSTATSRRSIPRACCATSG